MSSDIDIRAAQSLFKQIGGAIEGGAVADALEAAGLVLESSMKHTIRRMDAIDTGFMLNTVQPVVDMQSPTSGVVVVGTAADYAIYVEYGTYKMAARPFVRTTKAEYGDDAINAVYKVLKQKLKL